MVACGHWRGSVQSAELVKTILCTKSSVSAICSHGLLRRTKTCVAFICRNKDALRTRSLVRFNTSFVMKSSPLMLHCTLLLLHHPASQSQSQMSRVNSEGTAFDAKCVEL